MNAAQRGFSVGQQMQSFTLPLLTGETRSLESFLLSKSGGVIVFWSGVCSHCARYDAYLNDFAKRPNLSLVVIVSRQGETTQQLRESVRQRVLGFNLLLDADRATAHQCCVQQTPTAFLVDRQRRVLYRGAIDNFKYPQDPARRTYLDDAIDAWQRGQPIRRPETATFGCPIESVYYKLPGP